MTIGRSFIRRVIRRIKNHGQKYPVYFFHHVPKTGGTSVVEALKQWFDMQSDYFNANKPNDIEPIDIKELNTSHCVIGHFGHKGYHLKHRYPAVFNSPLSTFRYRCFTFIREPLDMRCSLYRHQVKVNPEQMADMSLAQHLDTIDNYTGRILGVTVDNYIEILDKYFFVGVFDDLQQGFDLLGKLTNKPKIQLPVMNTTKRESNQIHESLTDEQIASFKEKNHLDYLIYDYARKRQKSLLDKFVKI